MLYSGSYEVTINGKRRDSMKRNVTIVRDINKMFGATVAFIREGEELPMITSEVYAAGGFPVWSYWDQYTDETLQSYLDLNGLYLEPEDSAAAYIGRA